MAPSVHFTYRSRFGRVRDFLPLTSASASVIDGGSIGTTGVSWTIEDNGGLKTLNITGTGTPSDHPWTNSVAAQQIEAVHMG